MQRRMKMRSERSVKIEKPEFVTIAKAVIILVSMIHLIFASIHVKALLLLENETCGFIMFLFVLMGLVAMFEVLRIRADRITEKLFTVVVCVAASGLGVYLISIYRYAIANQRALAVGNVDRAVLFSVAIVAAYVISAVCIILDMAAKKQ